MNVVPVLDGKTNSKKKEKEPEIIDEGDDLDNDQA